MHLIKKTKFAKKKSSYLALCLQLDERTCRWPVYTGGIRQSLHPPGWIRHAHGHQKDKNNSKIKTCQKKKFLSCPASSTGWKDIPMVISIWGIHNLLHPSGWIRHAHWNQKDKNNSKEKSAKKNSYFALLLQLDERVYQRESWPWGIPKPFVLQGEFDMRTDIKRKKEVQKKKKKNCTKKKFAFTSCFNWWRVIPTGVMALRYSQNSLFTKGDSTLPQLISCPQLTSTPLIVRMMHVHCSVRNAFFI